MRLIGLSDETPNLNLALIQFLKNQEQYGRMILSIGRGTWRGDNYFSEDKTLGSQQILLPNIRCIMDEQVAIDFLYPNQFNTINFNKRVILAGSNKES